MKGVVEVRFLGGPHSILADRLPTRGNSAFRNEVLLISPRRDADSGQLVLEVAV